MKAFSVIKFTVENSVEAVPSTWLSDNNKSCFWPNKSVKNVKKLLADSRSLPGGDWDCFEVELIKEYGKLKQFFLLFSFPAF